MIQNANRPIKVKGESLYFSSLHKSNSVYATSAPVPASYHVMGVKILQLIYHISLIYFLAIVDIKSQWYIWCSSFRWVCVPNLTFW